MRIFRGQPIHKRLDNVTSVTHEKPPHHTAFAANPGCAVTIGNFDGLHLGHQAMLKHLRRTAKAQGLSSCVLTFEPHPRDYFAALTQNPTLAPARIATLRDKLSALASLGIAQAMVLPFGQSLASLSPQAFVEQILLDRLGVRYVLVGDDFRFGAKRAGDFSTLVALGKKLGFVVENMSSFCIDGQRVSSSRLRQSLANGDMQTAQRLLGQPYSISGHVVHGRKLGRKLGQNADNPMGFSTINLRFKHWQPATSGIFAVQVHGLMPYPLSGVANLGVRPSLDTQDMNNGRVLLETYCLEWPQSLGQDGAYGKIVCVDLLQKLHDEYRYPSLDALQTGIGQDIVAARAFFAKSSGQQPQATPNLAEQNHLAVSCLNQDAALINRH